MSRYQTSGCAVLPNRVTARRCKPARAAICLSTSAADQKVNAALFQGTLLALAGFRSYDPIRCQEPQWPRRPLAIGRRGLPLTRPGPPPACRRRLRLSLISADTVLSARTPFLRRGSPSLSRRMRRAPRAQRNRGYPRRPPGSPGRGLCLFRALPAHHAEGPEPPHELGRGGRVGLRRGHAAGEHLLAPPQEPLGPLPPVHPYLEGHARVPWHELRLVPCRGVAP